MTPLIFTDSVITYDLARKAEYLYDRLGMPLEKQYAHAYAEKIYKAIRKHLLVDADEMRFLGNSQTAQSMAIFYGLCESEDEKARAFKLLLQYIEAEEGHMFCGVLGGRVIFRVLCDFGYQDLAYNMIVRRDPPSYGYMIAHGFTALAEDIYPRSSSQNHHFWGDIAALMMEYFVGIRLNPSLYDLHKVEILPTFPSMLDYAKAHHKTPYGTVSASWRREGDIIALTLRADDALDVTVRAPRGYQVVQISSCEYRYSKI